MTAISMYRASVPVFKTMLTNLSGLLDKGAAFATAKKIDPTVLLNSRLAADMYPLTRQVQIASDNAKGCVARLAGIDPPKFEDNEKTIEELKERIAKTIAFLDSIKPEQINGSEERQITIKFPNMTLEFTGLDYLVGFATGNVYFHITTAYAILRHNGVELSKRDFIG